MSTAPRRTILVGGLGRFVPPGSDPDGKGRALVKAQMAEASELGFDCTDVDLNPADIASTLEEVKAVLNSKEWDGFSIGYGVRGWKENTKLFEAVVNLAVEIRPGMKLAFSTGPGEIVEALQRVFK